MSLDPVKSGPEEPRATSARLGFAALWAVVSTLSLVALYWRHRHNSLDGDFQGWASASCMVMARAFNQLGAIRTHFLPFQNNLPVGLDPDVYLHWPPLYPLVLSFFLRLLGDDPLSGRILALLITLGCGTFVLLIAKRLYSLRVGLLAVFFYFTSRATFEGSAPLLQQPLAMLFALASVYCFLRAVAWNEPAGTQRTSLPFAVLGIVSTMLTLAAAWDPVFIPFGLLATAMWLRHRPAVRLAAAYCVVAVLTFAGIEADYVLSYPKLFANQFATIAYRAGMHFNADTSVRLHTIVDQAHFSEQYGLFASYWRALRFVDLYFGPLLLVGCCVFLALWFRQREARRSANTPALASTWLIGSLLLPAIVWYVLMRNYVAIHPFPLVLPAPFVAISCGVLFNAIWMRFADSSSDKPLRWLLLLVVPLIVLHPLLVQYRDAEGEPPQEFANLSPLIQSGTPENAIVLTPSESLVPTYYCHRHLVRGIENDAWLAQATVQAHHDFPGAPLFLAVRDFDAPGFHNGLNAATRIARRGDSTLYTLP